MDELTVKQEIKNYLESLIMGIRDGHEIAGVTLKVQSEADLAIRVGLKAEGATLLRILGYSEKDVDDQVAIAMGSSPKFPDYVLGNPKRLIDLELKKPDEDIDDVKWARQVTAYCTQMEVPIGLLFNGIGLRVFINVRLFATARDKNSAKYKLYFSEQPVARADSSSISSMVNLLYAMSSKQIEGKAMVFGKHLAKKRIVEIESVEHQRRLTERLTSILSPDPPYIEDILTSLSTTSKLWSDFDRQPDPEELKRAWDSRRISNNNAEQKIGLRQVRQKIVEVSATKGWSAIEMAKIKGLNYRIDGVEGKGYRLIENVSGTNEVLPHGLCIQGMDAPAARRIFDSLDRLLKIK